MLDHDCRNRIFSAATIQKRVRNGDYSPSIFDALTGGHRRSSTASGLLARRKPGMGNGRKLPGLLDERVGNAECRDLARLIEADGYVSPDRHRRSSEHHPFWPIKSPPSQ
jgi:hypothetical protein